MREDSTETRRVDATGLAIFVGLDSDARQVCAEALGDAVAVVHCNEPAAARELVAALRPRMVVASAALTPAERAQLGSAATACGAHVVSLQQGMSIVAMERLLQGAAVVVFEPVSSANGVDGPCDGGQITCHKR